MKILFDAYWWHDGPPSGRMVVQELIQEWASSFPEDSLIALVREGKPVTGMPEQVELVSTKLRPHAIATRKLKSIARKHGVNSVISQNFAVNTSNSAVFVHDVLFQSNPEYFTPLERAYLAVISKRLPDATHVFTSSVSESERIRKYNPHVTSIQPVGLGVGTGLQEVIAEPPVAARALSHFVLTVGRLNVRKNLNKVFTALITSQKVSPSFPLLVVGEADGKAHVLDPAVQHLIDNGTIRFLGSVSNAELRWLYEHSSLLIFASLDEGFGLPPLEALHFGCPIAVSDIPVFRELYEDAANFFDPTDSVSIGRAIDSSAGSDVGSSSLRIAAHNSWARTVLEMRNAIERKYINVR
ncbi:glycosyltransferase family 1 protein [Pseudarthrobacter oxydans]|uniref:glycosyltransferase family 4 protein n=1 Tax=Pseudarthrobacter oxydans TaxID=1671 RepID=UPI002AA88194|nr:glycosyltransferase family 1 protein [Pseudarthrobacter oxydans]WPU08584.1 glycosyltransferase family 1 protein [Pseudarthrobacter oxydans]